VFEARLRRVLAACGLALGVIFLRCAWLQTACAADARREIARGRHRVLAVPPARGSITDADGRLLAFDEQGFELLADAAGLETVEWECGGCGRLRTSAPATPALLGKAREVAEAPGATVATERATPRPAPAAPPGACRCGVPGAAWSPVEGQDRESLAGVLGEEPARFAAELEAVRAAAWRAADRAAAAAPTPARARAAVRNALTLRRRVRADVPREAALRVALFPSRYRGLSVKAAPHRRQAPGLDAATAGVLGGVGPLLDTDEARLRAEGVDPRRLARRETGRSGIERAYEEQLRGVPGEVRVVRDLHGRITGEEVESPAVPGRDLRLTLSSALCAKAEALLGDRPGGLVAMDPTGAVLAVAGRTGEGAPGAPAARIPGSVLKALSAWAALEAGTVPAAGEVRCRHALERGRGLLTCEAEHGRPGLREAMAGSCNAYFSEAGRRTGAEAFRGLALRLGLGSPARLGYLPGHETGGVRPSERMFGRPWDDDLLRQVAIGQGPVTLSPVQVAALYAAIANGGRPVVPHLVEGDALPPGEPLASAATLRALRGSLEEVVATGTGSRAGLGRFRAAGKTGTAQMGGRRGSHAWFAGYAPAEDPRVVVVVCLEEVAAGGGGTLAAPLAAEFLDAWDRWRAGR
jgi:penicillin-binding protein 2